MEAEELRAIVPGRSLQHESGLVFKVVSNNQEGITAMCVVKVRDPKTVTPLSDNEALRKLKSQQV